MLIIRQNDDFFNRNILIADVCYILPKFAGITRSSMAHSSHPGNYEALLEMHHLKKTAPRLKVLSMLSNKDVATSQPDLESVMDDIDRVTLYRILNTFEEKGIIHKVFDLNGTANYAMCSSNCGENHHHDEHLHFNCTVCKNVYCLDDLELPALKLPNGFKSEGFTLYANGLCPKCSKLSAKKA